MRTHVVVWLLLHLLGQVLQQPHTAATVRWCLTERTMWPQSWPLHLSSPGLQSLEKKWLLLHHHWCGSQRKVWRREKRCFIRLCVPSIQATRRHAAGQAKREKRIYTTPFWPTAVFCLSSFPSFKRLWLHHQPISIFKGMFCFLSSHTSWHIILTFNFRLLPRWIPALIYVLLCFFQRLTSAPPQAA